MTAVIFDLDDTLIVEEATARKALAEAAAVGGAAVDDPEGAADRVIAAARRHWWASRWASTCRELGVASWEGLWATFEGVHQRLAGIGGWAADYRSATWRDALTDLGGDPHRAHTVADHYRAVLRDTGHPVIPTALAAVRAAADRWPVAVLTNGVPDLQRHKIDQSGLGDAVHAEFISGELGVGKPNPAAFERVLEHLGSRAAETVMVGDSWERDIEPALDLGMRAVWVRRGRAPTRRAGVDMVDVVTPEAVGAG